MNKKLLKQLTDKEVIAIVGPTASGKTAFSIELAKAVDGEIINGDALQVYKGLDIGTAKITEEEMQGVPHHLLSFLEPTATFSVADYQQLVREKIAEIQERGKMPIIVGGSGLYVQAVLYDFHFGDKKVDEKARKGYYKELDKKGPEAMHKKLEKLDPKTAQEIHPNNTQRVIRAIEMIEQAGVPKSDESKKKGSKAMYNHYIIGMDVERKKLYKRINKRVDTMLENGLLDEVKGLHKKGIRDVQSIQAIGYKELYDYLDDLCTLDDAIAQLKQNSRRYAKRQMTYFRNKMPVEFIDPEEYL